MEYSSGRTTTQSIKINIFASYFLRFTGTRNCPVWPCFLFCWETEATGKFTLAFTTTTHLLWSYLSLLVLGSDYFYSNLRLTLLMVTAQRYCEAMLLSPSSVFLPSWFYQFPSMCENVVVQPCPTLCNPTGCSLQASPSMGFSRQEY